MPGSGTRPDITTAEPPARLLDLTRLTRRAGRVRTGVDRVELAYARRLAHEKVPCFGLIRTRYGYILLPPEQVEPFALRTAASAKRPAPDLLSRLNRGTPAGQRQAETDARQNALDRCRPHKLAPMLDEHLPTGFAYINVGHSVLDIDHFAHIHGAGGRVSVMVHDVIPLEHPELQRDGTVASFERKMRAVQRMAGLILYNSRDTQARAEAIFAGWGGSPASIVAHLGTEPADPDPSLLPPGLPPERPYFVALGTIEPRKGHAFLLDIWEELGTDAPGLIICGSRGWKNSEVFRRLDDLPADGPIREVAGLTDNAIAALLRDSAGLLVPSSAEGFGLPAVEAARLGTPILCNELQVFQEILGDIPVYATTSDRYLWKKELKAMAAADPSERVAHPLHGLTWTAHFNTVLKAT